MAPHGSLAGLSSTRNARLFCALMTDVQDVRAQLAVEITPPLPLAQYVTERRCSASLGRPRRTPDASRKTHSAATRGNGPPAGTTNPPHAVHAYAPARGRGSRTARLAESVGDRLSRDQHRVRVRPTRSCPHDQRCGGRFRSWIGGSDDLIPGSTPGSSRTPASACPSPPSVCPTVVIARVAPTR